ncbi:hypothetical protein ACIA5E_29105 [Nocardia asteroides]|uniref:hypothetical protein n=1 Tax=Nocardia asteroides TaxID=1824 RepID=UPI00379B9935
MSRRRARPGRYRSLHVHGYRSASVTPILLALGGLVGGVFLLLVILTVTHMDSPEDQGGAPAGTGVVQTTAATEPPRPAPTVPRSCYPFAPSC